MNAPCSAPICMLACGMGRRAFAEPGEGRVLGDARMDVGHEVIGELEGAVPWPQRTRDQRGRSHVSRKSEASTSAPSSQRRT